MDLERIILRKSEGERQISYDVTFMLNLKYDTNEFIYKIDSKTQRTDLWLPRERDGLGAWTSLVAQVLNSVLPIAGGMGSIPGSLVQKVVHATLVCPPKM